MTTTTQALEGNNKVRAGSAISSRRLDDNDFRFGSYLVHTPPSTPSSSGNGGGGGSRVAVASRSNIPGYQFKSKIATINLQQSPPLSPKKGSPSATQLWGSGLRNGNSSSSSSTCNADDARRHHYQSQQSSLNWLPSHQPPNSSPTSAVAVSPPTPRQTPKAIPRSTLNLKQQSSLTTSNRTSHLQEYEPNSMGDRLSSPAIQHLSFNSSQTLSSSQAPGGVKPHHSVDSDHWNGQLSPNLPKYQFSQKNQVITRQRENVGSGGGGGVNSGGGGSCYGGDEIFKLTPRLPRGVSKIPHQVQAHENANANHYQSHESTIENCSSSNSINRYLTFNKDQATSHFKSLKEELGGYRRDTCRQANKVEPPIEVKTNTSTSLNNQPKPLERLSKTNGTDDNVIEHAKVFTSNTTLRQQPICEAFIMTGQSMLKLSCNESENNNNNNHNNINSHKQTETKLKSLSLNKLNTTSTTNQADPPNLCSEDIGGRHKSTQDQATTTTEASRQQMEWPEQGDVIVISSTSTTTPAAEAETKADSVTTALRSGMQTETITSTLTTSMKAVPELNNRRSGNVPVKNITSIDSVDLSTHQTATNIQPTTITETNKITTREPEANLMRIELTSGFWNKAPPQPQDKPNTIISDTYRAIRAYDETDLLSSDGHKDQSVFNSRSEQNISKTKLVVSKQQASPPRGGDSHHHQQQRNKNAAETTSTTTTMNETKEILPMTNVVVKPQETESAQIQEAASMSTVSSTTNNNNCNDRDSARRLAKRLYNLSGFKRSDVCHHLAKNNPFSQMVAEEYVNLFDFRSMKLDSALRKFLSKLQLNGETQERERMLSQFSQRYYDCNKDKFPNADIVQTLVCALILLNTDLHGGHSKKKRSKLGLSAFIDGLNNSIAGAPDCGDGSFVGGGGGGGASAIGGGGAHTIAYTFPRHLLIDLYESIKKRPLKCSDDKCYMTSLEAELDKIYSQQAGSNRSNTLPTRRFAPGSNAPSSTLNASSRRHFKQGLNKLNSGSSQDDFDSAIQFKSGYLNRKRVFEANGKRTSKGRRGWRRVYVTLQDLRMIMQLGLHDDSKEGDDQQTVKKVTTRAQTIAQKMKNTTKIHHTFAKRSSSYTKRDYVFHLKLADQSEYLMQANNEQEMNSWVDTINFATACLSSPALPSAISSTKQPQNQRPLLPAAYTKLSYWEQLLDHEERLQRLKVELDEHLSEAPNTKNANKRFKTEFIDKIAFLKHEIERYTVYVDLMRKKSNSPEAIILSKHPHIASLTPSDEMILSLPSFAPPRSVLSSQQQSSSTQLDKQ